MTDYTGSNTPADQRDLWRTPPALFASLDAEFCFQLDAAAARHNALCRKFITADPIFMVQKQATIYGLTEEFGESKIVHVEDCEWDSPQEYWDDLDEQQQEELNAFCIDQCDTAFTDLDEDAQWEVLADLDGHTVCGTRKEWQNINAHFTREAAEAFIRRKQHDYPPLRVYVESMYFGWEYQEIVRALCDGRMVLTEKNGGTE